VAKSFALLLAQIPLPTTCDGAVTELKMNPPAYGDQGRAAYAWDKFLRECEAKLGGPGKIFSAAEVNEIAKVINRRRGNSVLQINPRRAGLPPQPVEKRVEKALGRSMIARICWFTICLPIFYAEFAKDLKWLRND
jgi:hypothetical protein